MSFNFKILKRKELGRFAVASKNLSAGEIIFSETPFAVGPKPDSPPVCLGCYAPVEGTQNGPRCNRCFWPLCNACNQSYHHAPECDVFLTARVRFQNVIDSTASCPQLDCITPLRVLLAMENNPDRWKSEVSCMESHTERRRNSAVWNVDQVNIVGFLRGPCGLKRFSEEVIHKICGILEVNAFEARSINGFSVRCLFPRLAILSHSCTPNTTHAILPTHEFCVTVRTTVPVNKDTEIHSCYTYTLTPTIWRQKHLLEGKFFQCKCYRCSDPTELGTNMGTLKCQLCNNGDVVSTNPLDLTADWSCISCADVLTAEAVNNKLQMLQYDFEFVEETAGGVIAREELLKKFCSVLHPQHSLIISVIHSLTQLYGRASGYTLSQLTFSQLQRKVDLCNILLRVLNIIEPGYSRIRAMTLYELHAPMIMLSKLDTNKDQIIGDNSKLKQTLIEASELLRECSFILGWEDQNSTEGIIGHVAKQSLERIEAQLRNK